MTSSRPPVILAAFGTTAKAKATYAALEKRFSKRFPNLSFSWAFGSRFVQKHAKDAPPPTPETAVANCVAKGHKEVILQSLHVTCAAEFHRLTSLAASAPVPVTVGLPLLASEADCHKAVAALGSWEDLPTDTAVVVIIHGTRHPAGALFHLFGRIFCEKNKGRGFFGMLEGEPDRKQVSEMVEKAGFKKAFLVPFTLVAGRHLEKDIAGPANSWKTAFAAKGITTTIHKEGIGMHPAIADLFCDHLEMALQKTP